MIVTEKLKKGLSGLLTAAAVLFLLSDREYAADGVSQGLTVCSEVLIPALFPFMVLSAFAVNSGLADIQRRPLRIFFEKVLKLPCECLPAILFGFVGGYPVGASVTASLCGKGVIDSSVARRLLTCCVNAGPAFIITAVGSVMLGNTAAGIVLFVSVCSASMLTGLLSLFIYGRGQCKKINKEPAVMSLSDSFVVSVADSCNRMLVMCGWVIVFSAFTAIVTAHLQGDAATYFRIFAEVTSGAEYAVKTGGLPLTSACISFGGICVMCQLLPSIKKCGIKVYEYLLFRIVNSVISYFVTKALLVFVNVPVSVYATFDVGVKSRSVLSVAALLAMCAVFIYDVSSDRVSDITLADITG